MKKILLLAVFSLLLIVALSVNAQSESQQVLVNQWALGPDDSLETCNSGDIYSFWEHPISVDGGHTSASGCPKNPAPPQGEFSGGAAFHGTWESNSNIPVMSYQDFSLQERGVPQAENYEFRLESVMIVCVGCKYWRAELAGFNGTDWEYLGQLADLTPSKEGMGSCGSSGAIWWYKYCPDTSLVVPHYEKYRFLVITEWNRSPGIKWNGPKLLVKTLGDTSPLPTPTNTTTILPFPTSSNTPAVATPSATSSRSTPVGTPTITPTSGRGK